MTLRVFGARTVWIGLALFAVSGLVKRDPVNAQGAQPVTDVNVVNTHANPVPISGNVGITGTPGFVVANTAGTPVFVRNVDARDRAPYQSAQLCLDCSGNGRPSAIRFAPVPTGKRL